MQKGLQTTLIAKANGFLWQPWVAQYTCVANLIMSRDKTEADRHTSAGQSLSMTGTAQLSLLPASNYPFEAHFVRSDNRYSTDLATVQAYVSQGFGFSQNYNSPGLNGMAGFDRNTQNGGRDRQDTLQLTGSSGADQQRLQATANFGRNVHEDSSQTQHSQTSNVMVLQSLAPSDTISFENMASVSESSYRLRQANGSANARQLSSVAFWRPDETEMTVTGGARLLTLGNQTVTTFENNAGSSRNRNSNANLNAGVSYDAIRFTRISAAYNLNLIENNGVRTNTSSQVAGIGYQPDARDLGSFRYSWSTSANASRSAGGKESSSQGSVQAGHNISRSILFGTESSLGMDANQSLALISKRSSSSNAPIGVAANDVAVNTLGNDGVSKQLTHGASVSWTSMTEASSASVRLSASDARTMGGTQEFFQVVNLQATSNLPSSTTSSWAGNLTIQAVRQGITGSGDTGLGPQNSNQSRGFAGTSSGSLTYQQQRLFGIRRLRLVSDLRMNSQALLPLLGGPQDQEAAAWENRFDYTIGRTQFRLNLLLARTMSPATGVDPLTGEGTGKRITKTSKSLAISMSRAIGDL